MKRKILSSMILGAGLIFSSCTYDAYEAPEIILPTEPISFVGQIEPIFSSKGCTGCHPSLANLDLSAGNAYESLMAKASRVDTLNPEASLIYSKANPDGVDSHSSKYTPEQAKYVLIWIEEGAKNN